MNTREVKARPFLHQVHGDAITNIFRRGVFWKELGREEDVHLSMISPLRGGRREETPDALCNGKSEEGLFRGAVCARLNRERT